VLICGQEINEELPYWADYRPLLDRLRGLEFPTAEILNSLLPPDTRNMRGLALKFVPASQLAGTDYEKHIFETGEVSTRENNWHDLFNALVWCRMPRLKAAMNAIHYREMQAEGNTGTAGERCRGQLRDALTLLDESGVFVSGTSPEILQSLVRRDWNEVFVTQREAWCSQLRVVVCGHALLEKFLMPYKAMTAHAYVIHDIGPNLPEKIDEWSGRALLAGRLFSAPASLSPLPLAGIPGWWAAGRQDQVFYEDQDVFRPAPERLVPAPVHRPGDL